MFYEFHQGFLHLCELNTNISLYMSQTLMSKAFLIGHKNGNFVFLRDMHQGHIQDDDVFFRWTIQDTMIVLKIGLPF